MSSHLSLGDPGRKELWQKILERVNKVDPPSGYRATIEGAIIHERLLQEFSAVLAGATHCEKTGWRYDVKAMVKLSSTLIAMSESEIKMSEKLKGVWFA